MNKIKLNQTINKCILYYGVFGIVLGVIMFILTMIDPTIPFHVGEAEFYGFTAGILSLLSIPIIMAFVGLTHAILLWYPIIALFRRLMAKTK